MKHAFCTLVLRLWGFRCSTTIPTVRFYCICTSLSIRSSWSTCTQSMTKACLLHMLYDKGVISTRCACTVFMALCSIKVPRMARFLHSSTGHKMSWTYFAMLQQSRLPFPKNTSYSRSRKLREEDRDVKDSGSELGWQMKEGYNSDTHDQLIRELKLEDTNSFFNYLRVEPQLFDELLHRA